MQTFHRLRSIPGVGKILALILLYEMHDVQRFESAGQFLSYARLVRCLHESAGKKLGTGGKKIGNAHLRWAFAEAACLFLRSSERAKKWKQRQAAQRGEGKALAILAAKLGRRRLPHAPQGRGLRRGTLLAGPDAAEQYGLLFSVPQRGVPCRRLIFAQPGRRSAWPRCWSWSASCRGALGGQVRGPCPVHRSQSPRSRSFAAHLGGACGTASAAALAATCWICGSRSRASRCIQR